MSGNVVDLAHYRARRVARPAPAATAPDMAPFAAPPMMWMPVFFFVPVFFPFTPAEASRAV